MPFPVDIKYINETEDTLGLLFPDSFIDKMKVENGGEISTATDNWILFPFLNKLDKKTLSRTCNDIVLETNSAREWNLFPENAIAIGTNGCGDYLILKPDASSKKILDTVFIWRHENGEIIKVTDSINDLIKK